MDPSNASYLCLEKLRNHAHACAFLGTNEQINGELMSYFHDVYRPRSLLRLGCVLVRSINELYWWVPIVPEHERPNLHLRLESEDSDVVNDHIIKAILEADGVSNMEAWEKETDATHHLLNRNGEVHIYTFFAYDCKNSPISMHSFESTVPRLHRFVQFLGLRGGMALIRRLFEYPGAPPLEE
jgi:hypothetical protein